MHKISSFFHIVMTDYLHYALYNILIVDCYSAQADFYSARTDWYSTREDKLLYLGFLCPKSASLLPYVADDLQWIGRTLPGCVTSGANKPKCTTFIYAACFVHIEACLSKLPKNLTTTPTPNMSCVKKSLTSSTTTKFWCGPEILSVNTLHLIEMVIALEKNCI